MLRRSAPLVGLLVSCLAAGCGDFADKAELAKAMERIATLETQATRGTIAAEARITKLEDRLASAEVASRTDVAVAQRRLDACEDRLTRAETSLAVQSSSKFEERVARLEHASATTATRELASSALDQRLDAVESALANGRFKTLDVERLSVSDSSGKTRVLVGQVIGKPEEFGVWVASSEGKLLAMVSETGLSLSGAADDMSSAELSPNGLTLRGKGDEKSATVVKAGAISVLSSELGSPQHVLVSAMGLAGYVDDKQVFLLNLERDLSALSLTPRGESGPLCRFVCDAGQSTLQLWSAGADSERRKIGAVVSEKVAPTLVLLDGDATASVDSGGLQWRWHDVLRCAIGDVLRGNPNTGVELRTHGGMFVNGPDGKLLWMEPR